MQGAATAGGAMTFVQTLVSTVQLGQLLGSNSSSDKTWGPTNAVVFSIFAGLLVVDGILNSLPIQSLRILDDISGWWHIVGRFWIPDDNSGWWHIMIS